MITLVRKSNTLERLTWAELNAQRGDLLASAMRCRQPAETKRYVTQLEVFNMEVRRRRCAFKLPVTGL